jgi:hypothetical protein
MMRIYMDREGCLTVAGDHEPGQVATGRSREESKALAHRILAFDNYPSDACICYKIIGRDNTRHFRECPKRAEHPEPPRYCQCVKSDPTVDGTRCLACFRVIKAHAEA